MAEKLGFSFMEDTGYGFGEYDDSADFLHPDENVEEESLTETQYFGFNVPEENIHACTYMWLHPNLGTLTGGAFVWQGIKRNHLEAELFDWVAYQSAGRLDNDLHAFSLSNGYSAKVIKPLRRFQIAYDDPKRNNSFNITYKALMPPAMLPTGKHFEQAMKAEGDLVLRGEHYKVDCYNVRDRSWGQPRPEDLMPVPPLAWMTGVFNDNFSFNCSAFDNPNRNPDWKRFFNIPENQTLKTGWIYLDGDLSRLKSVNKITRRDPETLGPISHEMEVIDQNGREFNIQGKIVSACPIAPWPNTNIHICLTRWECNGMVGWGDTQEAKWNDYVYEMRKESWS